MSTSVEQLDTDELTRHAQPDSAAGLGALGTSRGNLPLERIDLQAVVTGLTSRIELVQGFRNPHAEALEATYIFPLPDRAAVTALRMEAGDRVVEGTLKERAEARADYDQAVAEGRLASIAEQERGDVFTLRVGNIMPGERVTVRLSMAGLLPFEDGAATFRFPLVVAPRYIPGAALEGAQVGDGVALDTDAVPDASRITPPVLLPGFPNPVRLSASVVIDPAGLPVPDVRSSLHATIEEHRVGAGARSRVIRLMPGDRANRDFVLRLHFGADDAVRTSLVVRPDAEDADEGTFALTVVPPNAAASAKPKDVALLLDRSGSMGGWKIVAARRAAARIIDSLGACDRFEVWTFDHCVEHVPGVPVGLKEATDRNRFRAVEHLAAATARGGTEMLTPLRDAVNVLMQAEGVGVAGRSGAAASDGAGREKVLVLVTDGQVGNEDQILRALAPDLAGIRVHTVGVDTAVHEGFLRSLAGMGGGRCELVESEDRLDEAMRAIHHRIATPLITGLRIEATGVGVGLGGVVDQDTICPARMPDLFAGAPIVITGRTRRKAVDAFAVSGVGVDGAPWRTTISALPTDDANLAAVWARMRIRDLEDRYATEPGAVTSIENEITATSLRFNVLSRFTAFVAVDQRVVNEGGKVHRVVQPVEMPQGWDMPAAVGGGVYGGAMPMVAASAAMAPPMPKPAASHGLALGSSTPAFEPMADKARKRLARRSMVPSAPAQAPDQPWGVPVQPWNSIPTSLRVFVIEARAEWRRLAPRPFDERRGFLARLAVEITERIATYAAGTAIEPWLRVLRELSVELAGAISDPVTLQHRWLHVGDVLEALAGGEEEEAKQAEAQPRSDSFWKR
jgi:Ca-activated chloride channel homolog